MQKKKVVEPEQGVPPTKNINRYGETSIRYVGRPLKPDQWKKSARDPNYGRRLPQAPSQTPPTYRAPLPPRPRTPPSPVEQRPPKQRPTSTKADFFISVPIFTETFDHSYRKKNEYVYGREDETSLYHQSLSRASSLRDLSLKGTSRSIETQPLTHSAPKPLKPKRRPRSAHRIELDQSGSFNRSLDRSYSEKQRSRSAHRKPRRRPQSGSEASVATYSSRGSYEDVRLDKAMAMKKAPKKWGILLDSDGEDER